MLRFALFLFFGFALDAGLLRGLLSLKPFGPITACLLSMAVTVSLCWLLFGLLRAKRVSAIRGQGFRYASAGLVSAIVSLLLSVALLTSLPTINPLTAQALSGLAAIAFGLFAYSRFLRNR